MPYAPTNDLHLPRPVAQARRHFYEAGWSYRAAAPLLGVCYQHLCQVLRGERQSRRLLAAIAALPKRPITQHSQPTLDPAASPVNARDHASR